MVEWNRTSSGMVLEMWVVYLASLIPSCVDIFLLADSLMSCRTLPVTFPTVKYASLCMQRSRRLEPVGKPCTGELTRDSRARRLAREAPVMSSQLRTYRADSLVSQPYFLG